MKTTFAAAAGLVLLVAAAPSAHAAASSDTVADRMAAFQSEFMPLFHHAQDDLAASGKAADSGDLKGACTLATSSSDAFSTLYSKTEAMIADIETSKLDASELKGALPDLKQMVDDTAKLSRMACAAAS